VAGDHTTTTAGNNKQREHVADDDRSNEGQWATKRARATWAIVLATRVACNKESNGGGSKSNGDKGAGQAMATWVMATTKATT
jgi:hypothetical protein